MPVYVGAEVGCVVAGEFRWNRAKEALASLLVVRHSLTNCEWLGEFDGVRGVELGRGHYASAGCGDGQPSREKGCPWVIWQRAAAV